MYKAPPITEAVIEIRFGTPVSADLINKASNRVGNDYPFKDDDNAFEVHVDMDAGVTKRTQMWTGRRLTSIDRVDVTIIRSSMILFSRLAPYVGWDQFCGRAQSDWHQIRKTIGFVKIERIGVRYINRIDIPFDEKPIAVEDFLNVYPESRLLELPAMDSFAFQIARSLGALDCGVVINSSNVPSPLLNHTALMIDFDIGRTIDVPQRDDDIWKLINEIRLMKNALFERSITDRTRAMFR